MISFEEFKKIELRIATIKKVEDHPQADKLYVLTIDVGDATKQIVAGVRAHYTKEELLDKQIVVVNNLQPVKLRGVESQGMLLAASDASSISVLMPERTVSAGSIVK
ncbi:MAG: methionine--tRNA ligase subunit beta [Candidatus Omnitrophica bacterium]|nr:methionine--tRNA ligase subunit beta [Candidatus Omnitrophota bacterium]